MLSDTRRVTQWHRDPGRAPGPPGGAASAAAMESSGWIMMIQAIMIHETGYTGTGRHRDCDRDTLTQDMHRHSDPGPWAAAALPSPGPGYRRTWMRIQAGPPPAGAPAASAAARPGLTETRATDLNRAKAPARFRVRRRRDPPITGDRRKFHSLPGSESARSAGGPDAGPAAAAALFDNSEHRRGGGAGPPARRGPARPGLGRTGSLTEEDREADAVSIAGGELR